MRQYGYQPRIIPVPHGRPELPGDIDSPRIIPEGLKTVDIPFFGMEDVNDDTSIVDDDPLASRKAILGNGSQIRGLPHLRPNGSRNGFELRLRCSRNDHKEIRE